MNAVSAHRIQTDRRLARSACPQNAEAVRMQVPEYPLDERFAHGACRRIQLPRVMHERHQGGPVDGLERARITRQLAVPPPRPGIGCGSRARQQRRMQQERHVYTYALELGLQPPPLEVVGDLPGPDQGVVLADRPRRRGVRQPVTDIGKRTNVCKVPIRMRGGLRLRRHIPNLDHGNAQQLRDDPRALCSRPRFGLVTGIPRHTASFPPLPCPCRSAWPRSVFVGRQHRDQHPAAGADDEGVHGVPGAPPAAPSPRRRY